MEMLMSPNHWVLFQFQAEMKVFPFDYNTADCDSPLTASHNSALEAFQHLTEAGTQSNFLKEWKAESTWANVREFFVGAGLELTVYFVAATFLHPKLQSHWNRDGLINLK